MAVHIGNPEIYEQVKARAIKSPDELVPGETYWTNSYPRKFVFVRLLTEQEYDKQAGRRIKYPVCAEDGPAHEYWTKMEWAEVKHVYEGQIEERLYVFSLQDRNMVEGVNYNPWHVFKTQEDVEFAKGANIKVYYSPESLEGCEDND
jgi:hypothetical protein